MSSHPITATFFADHSRSCTDRCSRICPNFWAVKCCKGGIESLRFQNVIERSPESGVRQSSELAKHKLTASSSVRREGLQSHIRLERGSKAMEVALSMPHSHANWTAKKYFRGIHVQMKLLGHILRPPHNHPGRLMLNTSIIYKQTQY